MYRSRRQMGGRSLWLAVFAVAVVVFAVGEPSSARMTSMAKPAAVTFRGVQYTLRWNEGTQYEFTPAGQEDLNAWTDMLTLNLYPKATTGEGLAGVANGVLGNYKGASGKIVRTNSVPATPTTPAEHFIAAVLPDPKFLEFAAARFVLIGKDAGSVVYSHRVYGSAAGNPMSAWMGSNGPDIEKDLMAFDVSRMMSSVKTSR